VALFGEHFRGRRHQEPAAERNGRVRKSEQRLQGDHDAHKQGSERVQGHALRGPRQASERHEHPSGGDPEVT